MINPDKEPDLSYMYSDSSPSRDDIDIEMLENSDGHDFEESDDATSENRSD